MKHKERFYSAFEHREADRVPLFEQSVASSVASALLGREAHTGGVKLHRDESEAWLRGEGAHERFVQQIVEDIFAIAQVLCFDALHPPWRFTERPTCKRGENDYVYGDPHGAHVVRRYDPDSETFGVVEDTNAPTTFADLEQSVRAIEAAAGAVEKNPPKTVGNVSIYLDRYGDEYAVAAGGAGLSIPLNQLWLEAVALEPKLVERYLEAVMRIGLVQIDVLHKLGVRIVWGGGDLADNHGVVYGPEVFREMVMPRFKAFADACHERGMWYLFRSDGNLWDITDDLFLRAGVDGYGEIDNEAGMDMAELKRRYPHVTFWGGVSCSLLHRGTVPEIIDTVKALIDDVAPGGGLIVGSSNTLVPGTPPENVLAMTATAIEYSRK